MSTTGWLDLDGDKRPENGTVEAVIDVVESAADTAARTDERVSVDLG